MKKLLPASLFILFLAPGLPAATVAELQDTKRFTEVPKMFNAENFILNESVKLERLENGDRTIDFIVYEVSGNTTCSFTQQFHYNEAKAELRLKRTGLTFYNEDGSIRRQSKISGDFNVGKDAPGYKVYRQLIRNESKASAAPAGVATKDHAIITDPDLAEKWRTYSKISYPIIKSSAYNTTFVPITSPRYVTTEFDRKANRRASNMMTVHSAVIRGTPQVVKRSDGDTKIYFQWVQYDEELPVALIDSCYYFDDAQQTLCRYDVALSLFDNQSGKLLRRQTDSALKSYDCPPESPAYGEYQRMRSGAMDGQAPDLQVGTPEMAGVDKIAPTAANEKVDANTLKNEAENVKEAVKGQLLRKLFK